MSTNVTKKRALTLGPALLIAAAALALSASGCVVDDNSGPTYGTCYPYLYVPWEIVDNTSSAPVTCDAIGADTVELDVNGQMFTQPCIGSASTGQFQVALGGAGTYTVDLYLLRGSEPALSEIHPDSFHVGCNDTQTPVATFPVIQQ
jgi:hypothetical protein